MAEPGRKAVRTGRAGRRKALPALALILLAGLSLLLLACGDSSPGPSPTANPAQEATKIDTILRDLLVNFQSGGIEAAREYARNTGLLDDQDRVRFGLTLTAPEAAPTITSQIIKMGGEVYSSSDERLGVAVSLSKLTAYFNSADKRNFFQELAAFKEVKELKLLLKPPLAALEPPAANLGQPNPARDPNEGVTLTGADRWQKAGFSGKGIQVGIIDGGFAGYRSFLGGALPPAGQVQFKSFLAGEGEGTEPHGVAVAEIVHSIAPDASLVLTPIEDEIGFTRAVQYLIERKVQVIQVSLGWGGIFPGDGSGKMDEKLDEARRAGILPVVSSGNYGQAHYLAAFNPNSNGFHRFSPDRNVLKLTAESTSSWVALRWEEPWSAPKTNLDLYILDANLRPLVSSRNEQGGLSTRPPSELAPFRTTPGQVYYVQVKQSGPDPAAPPVANPRFHLFAYNARLDEATPESSVATPGDARGALSVGAVSWKDDKVEPFSSRGPTGDGRPKPELVGPSGVSSLVLKQAFTGTSAAAPQVSGVAALLWSAAPDLTADHVSGYLTRNALDLGLRGRDQASGYGRVQLGPETAAGSGSSELIGAVASGAPYQDDFSNPASGLPDNELAYYGSAWYAVRSLPGRLNWNTYLNRSFEEFRAEVNVTPPGNAPGQFYGLVFWQQAPDDYFAWLVAGNHYAVLRRQGITWSPLVNWTTAQNLEAGSGSKIRLSLEATGLYLRLKAGDKLLLNLQLKPEQKAVLPARLGGRFGFVAGQFDARNRSPDVRFSDLVITPLTTR